MSRSRSSTFTVLTIIFKMDKSVSNLSPSLSLEFIHAQQICVCVHACECACVCVLSAFTYVLGYQCFYKVGARSEAMKDCRLRQETIKIQQGEKTVAKIRPDGF